MNGGMKKWVGRWPKMRCVFEEWLQRRDGNGQLKLQKEKEWWTGDGESDLGMISRITKRCLGKT